MAEPQARRAFLLRIRIRLRIRLGEHLLALDRNCYQLLAKDRKAAPGRINQLSPEAVYQVLTEQHPKEEARRYLYKVNQAEKGFKRTFSGRAG